MRAYIFEPTQKMNLHFESIFLNLRKKRIYIFEHLNLGCKYLL